MIAPFGKPLYVMAKPVGARCNLACEYCYYLEKEKLSENPAACRPMSDKLLEQFTRDYIQSQTMQEVLFTWHGGEPLLRPLSFYRKALDLQRRYAGGRHIDNAIQTNGTLLTDEWCRFLHDNGWLVGISIDGPRELHDRYRRSRGGDPSWESVMRGIDLLQKHDVDWNAMATVNACNADHPLEFYRFFRDIGAHYLQFTPVVERLLPHDDGRTLAAPADTDAPLAGYSVSPQQWGDFLCRIFDEWVVSDVGQMFVQLFDATLANWCGMPPGVCSMSEDCGHAAVMEANGDVYSCDHFVFPEYRLGNIRQHTLVEMLYGQRQQQFGRQKRHALPRQCRECSYLFACHGECPKNRFATAADGEPGLNYLCSGYHAFFRHAEPCMEYMRREITAGRPPANVMPVARRILAQ